MATDEEWLAFNPGFDHGEVNTLESNISGVFTAEKIAHLTPEQLHGCSVRMANLGGQACAPMQQQEAIRASGSALGDASTVLLAQDTGALATLLSGSQGANIAPVIA